MPHFLVAHARQSKSAQQHAPTFEIVTARDEFAARKTTVLRLTGGRVPRYKSAEHSCFASAKAYARAMVDEIAEANALVVSVERLTTTCLVA